VSFLLLFPCYCDTHDLPSFPTRRSSDLDVHEVKYLANEQGKVEIPFRLTGALPHVKPKPDSQFIARALSRAVVGKGLEKIFGKEDRKSTRLNSSHVSISYAVFCLKKKKI